MYLSSQPNQKDKKQIWCTYVYIYIEIDGWMERVGRSLLYARKNIVENKGNSRLKRRFKGFGRHLVG